MSHVVVTYCSRDYQAVLDKALPTWTTLGGADKAYVYSDQPLTIQSHHDAVNLPCFAVAGDYGERCARKAEALLAFMSANRDRHVLLLDADCFLVRNVSAVFESDFDVAAPIRRTGKHLTRFNSVTGGALFLKRTSATLRFLGRWVAAQNRGTSRCRDMRALAMVLNRMAGERAISAMPLDTDRFNNHAEHSSDHAIDDWYRSLRAHRGKVSIVHASMGTWRNDAVLAQALANAVR